MTSPTAITLTGFIAWTLALLILMEIGAVWVVSLLRHAIPAPA